MKGCEVSPSTQQQMKTAEVLRDFKLETDPYSQKPLGMQSDCRAVKSEGQHHRTKAKWMNAGCFKVKCVPLKEDGNVSIPETKAKIFYSMNGTPASQLCK